MTSPARSLVCVLMNLSSCPPDWLLSLTAFTMLSMKGTLQFPAVVFSVVSLQHRVHIHGFL